MRTAHVPTGAALGRDLLAPLVSDLTLEERPAMERFISGVFQVGSAHFAAAQHSTAQQHACQLVLDLTLEQRPAMERCMLDVFQVGRTRCVPAQHSPAACLSARQDKTITSV